MTLLRIRGAGLRPAMPPFLAAFFPGSASQRFPFSSSFPALTLGQNEATLKCKFKRRGARGLRTLACSEVWPITECYKFITRRPTFHASQRSLRVADEAWVALALLHRDNPARESFSAREIFEKVKAETAHPDLRPPI